MKLEKEAEFVVEELESWIENRAKYALKSNSLEQAIVVIKKLSIRVEYLEMEIDNRDWEARKKK